MQSGITAYTRDGIEVTANVFSIFTIGQPADIVQLTYAGDPRPEFLRVVILERISDTQMRVTNFLDELDGNDRDEIHRHIQHQFYRHHHPLSPYSDLEDTNTQPTFNSERVFAAVFSQARAEKDTILPWSELPSRVAASFFREILSQINFNQMYQIKEPVAIPLSRSRNRLRLEMRNNGMLSYRVLLHSSRQPLEKHRVYLRSELMVDEVKPLLTSKILRDRGIKVITASFGDILPVNEAIYLHRLESWKAIWQRDTEIIGAEKELEAMRIRSRARAMAQQDIVNNINSILRQTDISQEVLALRVLQALETLAASSTTKDLLPGGTLDTIKAARDWLLPGNPPPPNINSSVDGDSLI
jgi:hypothetical protein